MKFAKQIHGVFHDIFRAAGVNTFTVHGKRCRSRVKVFVLYLAQLAAVYRITEVRAEFFHVEPVRSPADLFVGSKGN